MAKRSIISLLIVVVLHLSLLMVLQAGTKTVTLVNQPVMSGALIKPAPAEIVEVSKAKPIKKKTIKKEVAKKKPKPTPPVNNTAISQQQAIEAEPEVQEKLETGAMIEPPRVDAALYNNPAPAYPSISRRLNESGVVLLEVLINADGRVGEVKLKKSSGFPRLDKTAVRAVKQWRYVAARQGGEDIAFWYTQPIRFSLRQ